MPVGFAGNEGQVTQSTPGIAGTAAQQAWFFGSRGTLYSSNTMLRGWSGRNQSMLTWAMEETLGRKPDSLMLRKMVGGTWSNQLYQRFNQSINPRYAAAIAGGDEAAIIASRSGLAKYAPTLFELAPSKHMAMIQLAMGRSPEGFLKTWRGGSVSMASVFRYAGQAVPELDAAAYGAMNLGGGGRASRLWNAFRGIGTLDQAISPEAWNSQQTAALGYAAMENVIPQAVREGARYIGRAWGEKGLANAARADLFSQGWGQISKAVNYGVGSNAGEISKAVNAGINKVGRQAVQSSAGRAAGMAGKVGWKAAGAAIPILDAVLIAQLASDVIQFGVKSGAKAVGSTAGIMSEDFRRGSFMTSSISPFVGATERQRALSVMQQTGMNLQSVLGNEASYFG